MRNFKLIKEVDLPGRGILKIVEPFEDITHEEVHSLQKNDTKILIDDKEFTVISYQTDLLPFDPYEEFRFLGTTFLYFLVENHGV